MSTEITSGSVLPANTILLVEDNLADVRLLKEALKACKSDVELLHSTDGVDALILLNELVKQEEKIPKIILLDLNLPRKDGRSLLADIKSSEKLKKIPVIVMSTSANPTDISDCYKAGANCYVTKPVELEKFFQLISLINEFWIKFVL